MTTMHTFSRWVATPENRSALVAIQRVAECVASRRQRREINPLYLHGPPGTGKSHLVSALAAEVRERSPDLAVAVVPANELRHLMLSRSDEHAENEDQVPWEGDLLVIEDVQHLRSDASETLVQAMDWGLGHHRQVVVTGSVGPNQLGQLPRRVVSRLACGLVARVEPFSPTSRLAFLRDRTQFRQRAVGADILAWLAEHVGGSGRQLEGALGRLEELARLLHRLPDLEMVAAHFREEAEGGRPTVERIVERVSRYFRVDRRQLQSRRRSRHALVPRQVGMYLARQLTGLSLEQIGAFFGGRDHSTVLHACRKIDQALTDDPTLSGVVRQLQAEFG